MEISFQDCNLNTAKCIEIRCSVSKLNKRTSTTIMLISRIWNSTLVEDYNHVDWVSIISRAQIQLADKSIEQDITNDYTQVSRNICNFFIIFYYFFCITGWNYSISRDTTTRRCWHQHLDNHRCRLSWYPAFSDSYCDIVEARLL